MSSTIQARLKSIQADQPLMEKIHKGLNKFGVQTKITFWGKRVITYSNKAAPLNPLFKMTAYFAHENFKFFEKYQKESLSTEMRIIGLDLCKKFHHLYEKTDKQIKQCNFLTRLFVWIREFNFYRFAVIFKSDFDPHRNFSHKFLYVNSRTERIFSAYREMHYQEIFGKEHEMVAENIKGGDVSAPKYKHEIGRLKVKSSREKIVVAEDAIRALKA